MSLTLLARNLRNNPTEAERKLWLHLRGKQYGVKFRRQQKVGMIIADFLCFEIKLIIELDGSQHADNPDDTKRTEYLESQGFKVIRFWNNQVNENLEDVLEEIYQMVLIAKNTLPLIPPSGRGIIKALCLIKPQFAGIIPGQLFA